MKYARIVVPISVEPHVTDNGTIILASMSERTVMEVFIPVNGCGIEECFHPDVAVQFEICPDDVEVGWSKQSDGTFTAPPPPAAIPVTIA